MGTGPWISPVAGYTCWFTPPEPVVRASPPMCRCTLGTLRSTVMGLPFRDVKTDYLFVRHLTSKVKCVPNARMNVKELFDLTGKIAVVTGGAGGIGEVYAEALCEVGAS